MEQEKVKRNKWLLIPVAIIVLAALYLSSVIPGASVVFNVVMPLIVGASVAYILNIVLKRLEKLILPKARKLAAVKIKRMLLILITLLMVVALAVLAVYFIVPALKDTLKVFTESLPKVYEWVKRTANRYSQYVPGMIEYLEQNPKLDVENIIRLASNYLVGGAGTLINSATDLLKSAVSVIYSIIMSVIFTMSLLYNKENLINQCNRIMKAYIREPHLEKTRHILTITNQTFSSFIVGQALQAAILSLMCIGGMLLFRFPEPVMIGIFVGAMALIPLIGAYAGSIVGILIVLAQNPDQALWFALFIICLQQLVGSVLYPKIVGKKVGLPGMWVLAAVLVGGGLFGVGGMIIGVPIAATVYQLLREDVNRRERVVGETYSAGEGMTAGEMKGIPEQKRSSSGKGKKQ